jgi:hypothetical protein
MKRLIFGSLVAVALIVGLSIAVAGGMFRSAVPGAASESAAPVATASQDATAEAAKEPLRGRAALEQAAEADNYLFAMFWERESEQTTAMRQVVSAAAEASERADSVFVQVTDPAEQEFVEKFRLDRAPMPLVLAIAPNGAVTGGFPYQCEEQELLEAVTTPGTADVLKALQDGKLVFLCVQNGSTDLNNEALQGVDDFTRDPVVGKLAEVVMLDPQDPAEASFLSDLGIEPHTSVAVTALLVPPGTVAAKFEGPTSKEIFMAAFQRSCGPGGCGPR